MLITYLIIGFTVLFSAWAFENQDVTYKCRHWPYAEVHHGEYYRLLTGGFVHANFIHLLFNMFSLYSFGPVVEREFHRNFPGVGATLYIIFYLVSIAAASMATHFRYKDYQGFTAIGASGAVSAIIFSAILINPAWEIGMFLIPIGIPGLIFGPLFLWFSAYMAQRGGDGIDHSAHFYGAVFGFIFPIVFKPHLFLEFIGQLTAYIS